MAWQVPGCGRQGDRASERRAGRQEQRVTGVGTGPVPCHLLLSPLPTPRHRPKSVTSCFFLFPQLFFSYAPRQIDRTHAHASRRACAHIHHHSGPGIWIWICIWDPDLTLCCTYPARPLPPHISSVQEVVYRHCHVVPPPLSSIDDRPLPVHPEVCETGWTRQTRTHTRRENRSAQTDNKTVASCELFQPSETSRHIYPSTVFHSSPSIS